MRDWVGEKQISICCVGRWEQEAQLLSFPVLGIIRNLTNSLLKGTIITPLHR